VCRGDTQRLPPRPSDVTPLVLTSVEYAFQAFTQSFFTFFFWSVSCSLSGWPFVSIILPSVLRACLRVAWIHSFPSSFFWFVFSSMSAAEKAPRCSPRRVFYFSYSPWFAPAVHEKTPETLSRIVGTVVLFCGNFSFPVLHLFRTSFSVDI